MTYPKMIIMRNTCGGCIWQAYRVENEQEETILTKNARHNGFIVQSERENYTTETSHGWRDSSEWKQCLAKNHPNSLSLQPNQTVNKC